jgi:glycosyltransferase involved in cell wall biosynthesis
MMYPHNRLPSRTLWIQLGLGRSIARARPDLCHFLNYLAPVLGRLDQPFVVTMYDMSVYRCPQYQPIKTVGVHRAIMPAVARRARLILTISESARQDIVHYLKVPEERVRVVYPGLAPEFDPGLDRPSVDEVRARYRLDTPYVLTVGTLEPRKNQAALIDAFLQVVRQERLPHQLVMVGPHGWKERPLHDRFGAPEDRDVIRRLGYVPTVDLPALYRGAEVFAFPSLYEGFGLPVLEAMACGTPTLISTAAALNETAGSAALAVDPRSTDDIAQGLLALLTDGRLATSLRTRSLERATHFRWENSAAQTYALYREALAG